MYKPRLLNQLDNSLHSLYNIYKSRLLNQLHNSLHSLCSLSNSEFSVEAGAFDCK